MIGPEVMRAFDRWAWAEVWARHGDHDFPNNESCYPLYIGAPHDGRWYVRERLPGTRVWRAEEDGSFTLIDAHELAVNLWRSKRGFPLRRWTPDGWDAT